MTLRSSSAVVVRQPDEAFSTHTVLRKCGATLQIGCRRKGVARAGARQVPSQRRQVVKSLGGCLHCRQQDPAGRSQLDQVPRRRLQVSTTANQNERPSLALAPNELRPTWTRSRADADHVSGYFEPAPAGTGSSCGIFPTGRLAALYARDVVAPIANTCRGGDRRRMRQW